MGVRNYLIEGGSGTGKTSVADELQRRGYQVIHGDRELSYRGDPETGEPLDWPSLASKSGLVTWGYEHWIWPVDKVKSLIEDQGHPTTFFCGHSANLHLFVDSFDEVFVLKVDLETLHRRLEARPGDEFGADPIERALITRLHATHEDLPLSVPVDAALPVERVVDSILETCIEAGMVQ